MNITHSLILSLVVAATVPAQTQLLRGKVEDVRNTTNQFYLDGTAIPLVSKTLNLNTLVGLQSIMQVVNIGTGAKPILDIRSATVTTKMLDMGNLRFGRAERWQVNAAPGSRTAVYANGTVATSYLPLGNWGTWLVGTNALHIASGTVTSLGQFEFTLTMPTIPLLLGVSFTSQAAVQAPTGQITLSNPDAKEVRSK